MANLRILKNSLTSVASITASTTAGALGPSNLITNDSSEFWRATSTTAFVTVTLPVSTSVDSVVLGWTNIATTATVTVDFYTLAADTVPVVSVSPTIHPRIGALPVNVMTWLAQPVTCRKIRVTVSSNVENVQIGHLFVGKFFEVEYGHARGAALKFEDDSIVARTESGSMRFESKNVRRRLEISLPLLSAADSTTLMNLFALGQTQVLFVSLYPDSSDVYNQTHAFIAHMPNDPTHATLGAARFAQTNLTFQELL